MILSFQVAMAASFFSSIIAAFSHKFDDGFFGKVALSCIGLCSFFGYVNLSHGLVPEDAIIVVILSGLFLVARQYWLELFSKYKPKVIIMIKSERSKSAVRGRK